MKLDKMGVLVLMSHLIITLAMLALYALFTYLGKPVTTIENMLLVVIGYWFGAIGASAIRATNTANTDNAQNNNQKGA